jgi:hypothetical protein
MWELISAKDTKKYQMVQTLFRRQSPITVHDLAKSTGLSQRSVMNYLDELRNDLEHMQGKIVTSKAGVKMHLPPYIGLDIWQKNLYRESTAFNILEALFFQGSISLEELEDRFFLSTSSLERLLRKLRASLEPYNISVTGNPITIQGDEYFIRTFFTRYFTEAYSCEEWPFLQISKSDLVEVIENHPPYCPEFESFIKPHELLTELSVSILRSTTGYPMNDSFLSPFMKNQLNLIRKELQKELQESPPNFALKEILVQELSYLRLQYTVKHHRKRMLKDKRYKDNIRNLLYYVRKTTKLFDLKKEIPWPFIIELYKLIESYASTGVLPKHILFRSRDYILVPHVKEEFPYFYIYVSHVLKEVCRSRSLHCSTELVDQVLYAILIYSENLIYHLFMNFKTCKVLLYSHLSRNHAETVKDSLTTIFNRSIQVEYYTEIVFKEEYLSNYDFDLLLSTTSLHLSQEIDVLYLSYDARGHQMEYIRQAIEKVVDIKKKTLLHQLESYLRETTPFSMKT